MLQTLYQPRLDHLFFNQNDSPAASNSPHQCDNFNIISQNISSLSFPCPFKYHSLLSSCEKLSTDVICLSETNVNSHMRSVREIFHEGPKRFWAMSKISYTSTPTKSDVISKFGGTCMITTQYHVHQIQGNGSDSLGRWTWTKYYGKDKPIVVIVAYMPCQISLSACGPLTYVRQLWWAFRTTSNDEYNPFHAAWTDLQLSIEEFSMTCSIILCMDANSNTQQENSDFSKFWRNNGLHDILQQFNPEVFHHATYKWGSNHIDTIMCSYDLLSFVKDMQVLLYDDVVLSDHKFLFVSFDSKMLFSQSHSGITQPGTRRLQLRSWPVSKNTLII